MPYAGSLNLTSPATNRIYQRDVRLGNPPGNWSAQYDKGWGTIVLNISPTVPVDLLEYRIRDADGTNALLLDWTKYSGAVVADTGSITLVLPARVGWSIIDMRADGDDLSTVSTGAIGIGEVVAASGQSLASDFWSTIATGDPTTIAGSGVVTSVYGTCLAAWDGGPAPSSTTAWSAASDTSEYRSSFCAEFLRLAVLGTGVNCGLVGYAWSGEPIASWRTDGSGPKNVWAPLTACLDSAVGSGGKFGTFIWAQGHNDARIPQSGVDGDELSTDQYVAALDTLLFSLAARYDGAPFTRILSSIPAIGDNWVTTNPKYAPYGIENIRAAHLSYARTDPLVLGHVDGLDTPLWSDGTHPSQTGNVVYARHFYRAFMKGINATLYTAGDSGATFAGVASRAPAGSQIFLPVSGSAGSGLSCSSGSLGASTQFQVFRSGSTAPENQIVVEAVDFPRLGLVVLTLAITPSDDQSLDVWYRLPPDSAMALAAQNQIYDDNVAEFTIDGLTAGRQLAMYAAAILVPAPMWHRPMLTGPGTPMLFTAAETAFAL